MGDIEKLADSIADAAKKAFLTIFENKERYYYCALVTTGNGDCPIVSAWSWEALQKECRGGTHSEIQALKWSYADSPYCAVGQQNFKDVETLLSDRPSIDDLDDQEWEQEFSARLEAMVSAMEKLDQEGLFALNQPREDVLVIVDPMPPGDINTQIALRLNRPSNALNTFLAEAAE